MLRSIILAAACATACYTSVGAYGDNGYYGADSYAAPGVSVVAGTEYPVFYTGNTYWAYSGGYWYNSPFCCGGWVLGTPPAVILSINNPYRFAHFRGYGYGRGYYGHNYYNRGYYGGRYGHYGPYRGYYGRYRGRYR